MNFYFCACSMIEASLGLFYGYLMGLHQEKSWEFEATFGQECSIENPGLFWFCELHYIVFWNEQLSKTTTLPNFAFERWNSQDVILKSWCSVTMWRACIKRIPLRIWSNCLARMLCQKPRSFSGSVNLDETGWVSMMSTSAAHQWVLLW